MPMCPQNITPLCLTHTGAKNVLKILKKAAVPSLFAHRKNLDYASKVDERGDRVKNRSLKRRSENSAVHRENKRLHLTAADTHDDSSELSVDGSFTDSLSSCVGNVEVQDLGFVVCDTIGVVEEIVSTPTSPGVDSSNLKQCRKKSEKPKTFRSVSTQTLKSTFIFETLRKNPNCVSYFTGLENFDKFMLVLHSLGPARYELKYRYHTVESVSIEDQFLMTLMKLRRGIPDIGLAYHFFVSKKTVQDIVVTWINFMYHEWKELNIWPSKDLTHYYMPEGFRKVYPSTRVIIDGTEIPISSPKNPLHSQAAFSTYKNRATEKILVGATPSGLISYCSEAYAGSVSDRAIVERSDLTQKCDPGDSIMADRGFTVQDLFAPCNVAVNIPSFLKGQAQLPGLTLLKDRKLASKRVHIERVIGLVKTYKILKKELPPYYVPLGSQISFVCCMLCNFREGIVSRYA
ncbi:hypothetical protein FOCC_FOCC006205 [Frankliniella occidentalis]|uniref:Uncharacterized protein LOC127749400 n=1 Tax=Frankliniella occidentalis TaxID=133901 RepID=A0A9C6UB19_FRAOC|nr:uncharacterized protein LOC127749400 [Frankliniella occidentalis]KAE8747067.1 hypothetical protein FOCC_FOCC006205 [Frankliniella occidentalis]